MRWALGVAFWLAACSPPPEPLTTACRIVAQLPTLELRAGDSLGAGRASLRIEQAAVNDPAVSAANFELNLPDRWRAARGDFLIEQALGAPNNGGRVFWPAHGAAGTVTFDAPPAPGQVPQAVTVDASLTYISSDASIPGDVHLKGAGLSIDFCD